MLCAPVVCRWELGWGYLLAGLGLVDLGASQHDLVTVLVRLVPKRTVLVVEGSLMNFVLLVVQERDPVEPTIRSGGVEKDVPGLLPLEAEDVIGDPDVLPYGQRVDRISADVEDGRKLPVEGIDDVPAVRRHGGGDGALIQLCLGAQEALPLGVLPEDDVRVRAVVEELRDRDRHLAHEERSELSLCAGALEVDAGRGRSHPAAGRRRQPSDEE